MKTKSIFKSALVVLLLGASVNTMAENKSETPCYEGYVRLTYTMDGYQGCQDVKANWNPNDRTFTVSNIFYNVKDLRLLYYPDCSSICDTCIVFLGNDSTYISGNKTFTSNKLDIKYGDPLQNHHSSLEVDLKIGESKDFFCGHAFNTFNLQENSISDIITNSITISPNPATPSETITIKGEYATDAKVSITSAGGSMVGCVIPSVGADAMTVSLSGLNLQAGIYFVRIDSGEKVYVGKLCVK